MGFFGAGNSERVKLSRDGGYTRAGSVYRFWRCPMSESVVVHLDLGAASVVGDGTVFPEAYCARSVCRRVCECEPPKDVDGAPVVRRYAPCWKR